MDDVSGFVSDGWTTAPSTDYLTDGTDGDVTDMPETPPSRGLVTNTLTSTPTPTPTSPQRSRDHALPLVLTYAQIEQTAQNGVSLNGGARFALMQKHHAPHDVDLTYDTMSSGSAESDQEL